MLKRTLLKSTLWHAEKLNVADTHPHTHTNACVHKAETKLSQIIKHVCTNQLLDDELETN
jgi:hypothetical protein